MTIIKPAATDETFLGLDIDQALAIGNVEPNSFVRVLQTRKIRDPESGDESTEELSDNIAGEVLSVTTEGRSQIQIRRFGSQAISIVHFGELIEHNDKELENQRKYLNPKPLPQRIITTYIFSLL